MTCTHPLWGTKTTTYEWTRPCNTGISHPTDEEMNDPNKLLRYISQAMNELVELGFNVPIEYRTISNLLNPVNLNNATIFRLALAGYSVTVEGLESDCFVPVISLPVLVPLYNEPEVNFNCVSVSPNPSSLNLTVNLGNNNIFIDKIELIENSTGTIVYQKNSSFLINENIAVSSLNKGQYTLKITNGEIINSRQIVIE
ncbi:MAG: T9SS type A sorting domain-containing protein [Bacteroidetes bacterium]|nr:T9SS type A sorting domain-containing protein [Bacteroidota bacterium]